MCAECSYGNGRVVVFEVDLQDCASFCGFFFFFFFFFFLVPALGV